MAYIGRSVDIGNFEKQVLTPDSSTTTFTLSFGVGSANSLLVVYGGVIQEPNVAYAISGGGTQIVFSEAPATGTTLYIVYLGKQMLTPRAAGQETTKQTFTGDGTTAVFTLTDPPVVPAGIMVFVDGILQREGSGNNFVSSGSTIAFSTAPDSGAEIDVYTLVKEKVSIDTVADGSITRSKLAQSAPYWEANGYVGIGDATPTSSGFKLSIKDATYPYLGLTGTANGANAIAIFRTAQSGGGQVGVVDGVNQQIIGSAIGDMFVRTNTTNSKILFSTDSGLTFGLAVKGDKVLVGYGSSLGTASARLQVYDSRISIVSTSGGNMGGIRPISSLRNSVALEADPDNVLPSSDIGFYVDGNEAARIDANKNLTVNPALASAQHPLQVNYLDNSTSFSSQTPGGIAIQNTSTTVNSVALMSFKLAQAQTVGAGIGLVNIGNTINSSSYGDLAFYTKDTSSQYLSERTRLTSTGVWKNLYLNLGTDYSNSYTTDNTWSSGWVTVVPSGALSAPGGSTYAYLIRLTWNYNPSTGGNPYYANCSTIVTVTNCNATGGGTAISLFTSSHVVTGYMQIRPVYASASTTGIQVNLVGFTSYNGFMYVDVTRISN